MRFPLPFRSWLPFSALLLAVSPALLAQTHHVDAPKSVTRALGVYEWTGDLAKPTAARFVPVSLFLEGHFEDAGVYLARPVPFALATGNLYALEQAGEPRGTLSLESARNVVSQGAIADDNPVGAWYGYGKYVPPPTEKPAPKLRASATTPVIVSSKDDGKPHFSNKPAAGDKTDTAATTKPATDADPDRPHMTRRTDVTTETETTDKLQTDNTDSKNTKDPNDRPTLQKHDPRADAKRRKRDSDAMVIPTEKSLNDDPDRPTLHRGTPEEAEGVAPLTGLPKDMRQSIAVSDAAVNDTHPFTREWESATEREQTLAAMQTLARKQVEAYFGVNKLVAAAAPAEAPIPVVSAAAPTASNSTPPMRDANAPTLQRGVPKEYAKPAPAAAVPASASSTSARTSHSRRVPAPRAPSMPLLLLNEQLGSYSLSYGGLPTFVYTVTTPARPLQPAEALPTLVHTTVVAQRLPSGELQVGLSSVTDEQHLNRAPWLRLVDAVDPDDSHRASLLFEMRAASSRQFALYRLTSAKAAQIFVTRPVQ